MKVKSKSARVFQKVCEEMDSDTLSLLLHTMVHWLSCGKVLACVLKLRWKISVFLAEKNHEYARNHEWVSKFLTMNGFPNWHIWLEFLMCCPHSTPLLKGRDQICFPKLAKFSKGKIDCWANEFSRNDCSSVRFLNEFVSEGSEVEDTAEIKELVFEHLKLVRKNFNWYFPEEESEIFHLLKWVVNLLFSLRNKNS